MIDLYNIIAPIIIGIIEGVTELLPVSSTGHVIIVSHWLKIEANNIKMLFMFMQLGSAVAILYFFQNKILIIFNIKNYDHKKQVTYIHIILAILPTILIGLIFYYKIKILFNPENVMYGLLLGSFFLIIAEMFKPKRHITSNVMEIDFVQSIIVGLVQVISLYPGISRSGITIAIGMLLGIKKSVAIEFSFIMSIPILIGASFLHIIQHIHEIEKIDFVIFLSGFAISFIISMFCIKRILSILNTTSMIFFAIYRMILAGLIYFIN